MAKSPKVTKEDRIRKTQDDAPHGRARRLVPVLVAVVTITAFSTGVWYAYDQGVKQGIRVKPPLIKAEPGPTKVVPENPGGLQIPNQDKQVFGRIASTPPEPKVEHLLPPQETPLPEQPAPAEPKPSAGESPPEGQTAETPQPAPEPMETATTEPPATAPAKTEPEKPKTVGKPPEPEATPPSPPATGTVRVQLAAFREEQVARTGWDRLMKKYSAELSGLKPVVVRVDLGKGKGIFYRLQAGPLKDKRTAERLCESLKAHKQSCLVIDTGS